MRQRTSGRTGQQHFELQLMKIIKVMKIMKAMKAMKVIKPQLLGFKVNKTVCFSDFKCGSPELSIVHYQLSILSYPGLQISIFFLTLIVYVQAKACCFGRIDYQLGNK
jgi:hypothetical protein